jgi:hypothetical protein
MLAQPEIADWLPFVLNDVKQRPCSLKPLLAFLEREAAVIVQAFPALVPDFEQERQIRSR